MSRITDVALLVALSVHLFTQSGAGAVAALGVVRTLAPAVGMPVIMAASARVAPRTALAGALSATALGTIGIAAIVLTNGPILGILALSGLVGITAGALRPLVAAFLPRYIHGPQALVATNAASTLTDSIGASGGPLLAGVATVAVGPGPVVGAVALLLVANAGAASRMAGSRPPSVAFRNPAKEAVAGARELLQGRARVVVLLGFAQAAVRGALNVIGVVLAIEHLAMGDGGIGILLGALGIGGLVGMPLAVRVARLGRMGRMLGVGVATWGLPLIGLAVTASAEVAFVLLMVTGVGNTLVDIAVETLIQRLVPSEELPRAIGALYAFVLGGVALGALVGERLLSLLGAPTAIGAVGAALPAVALLSAVALRRLDEDLSAKNSDIAILQLDAIFSPLVLATVDSLARRAETAVHEPGAVIVAEGDVGDRYYVIEAGEVDVSTAGEHLNVMGPGDGFGELALLDGAPRNATVRARTVVRTRSLGREDFLLAIDDGDARVAAHDQAAVRRRVPPS